MAFPAKFTIQRGKVDLKDVVVAAGAAEAQTDTFSLNMDVTNLTKGEAVFLIDELKQKVMQMPWPPL
jgi:hypothetical protein